MNLMYMDLHIRKFDMNSIVFRPEEKKGPVIVFIGRRDTGKSFLVRDLLYHHQSIPVGTVISGTEAGNGFYAKLVPKLFIHNHYSSETIDRVLKRQKIVVRQYDKDAEAGKRHLADPRCFVILDDCLFDNKWTRDKLMLVLFLNGRHWKVMLVITMQYPLGIPPLLRTNIDYVFILRDNYLRNRKLIWENYASMFPTLDSFCSVMDQCTQNYECLVINNNTKSNNFQDQIFWYKAEDHGPFRLGSKKFWEISQNLADDSDDDAIDDSILGRGKKQNQVIVKKVS